ncbi:hypothetical protein SLE2022_172030 [Rubroshorea leprosula]
MEQKDNVPCQIEEGLFLGSIAAANNKNALKSSNITHILTVAGSLRPAHTNDFVYKVIPVLDKEDTNITQSRSVTIVVAYLMKKRGMSPSQASEYVKSKRPQAAPNSGFLSQLQEFEKSLQGA